MNNIKKKIVRIFSNGSLISSHIFLKQQNKIQISDKDHASFICYQKNKNSIVNSASTLDLKRKNFFI